MNYNLTGYLIYFSLMAFIILKVGYICYNNGIVFVGSLLPKNPSLGLQINKLLLVGYYLVNMGYIVFSLSQWETLSSLLELIEAISQKATFIILGLAGLHYLNIFTLSLLFKNKNVQL